MVICGGKGTRLLPDGSSLAKSMVPLAGRPMIEHIVAAWRPLVGRFLFVVDHRGEQIAAAVQGRDLPHHILHEEGGGRGIAAAVAFAREHIRTPRFVVVLGDCVHRGTLSAPPGMVQGVGVFRTRRQQDIRASYSVEHVREQVVRVVEKPSALPNDLCGTGFYFFEHAVFEHIATTPPSGSRRQVEITHVLQHMVDAGLPLSAVHVQGGYVNVNYPEDLLRAEAMLATP